MTEKILRKRHITALVLVFLVLSFFTESFFYYYKKDRNNNLREKVTIQATKVQTALNHEINSTLNLVQGMIAYINTVDSLTEEEFTKLAEILLRESDIIRNIVLAPDNVVSYVYPLEGNEKVLGLDYMKNTEQKTAVVRAMKTGKTIIAGPVNLVQGGRGFVARIPIFRDKGRKEYMGVAGIVIDEIKLYGKVRLLHSWHWLDYAIKGKDAKGLDGDLFFGKEYVFKNNPVTLSILLPVGNWILGAYPKHGWNSVNLLNMICFRLAGYSITVLVVFLLYNLMRSNVKLAYFAHIDPLTGISNRRFFHSVIEKILLREKRESGKLFFLYFDLDGFKSVNDNYGHKTGDAVLIEAVNRIKKSTRESDIFARMGGDEFLFVPMTVKEKDNAKLLSEKIINAVNSPYQIGKKVINIGCSIGISIYPDDSDSIDRLVKLSDQAMYTSKSRKSNTVTFYSDIETVFVSE